jgi:hypothetical protein
MKKWTRVLAITLTSALVASAIGAGVVLAADPTPTSPATPGQNYGQLFLEKLTSRLGISLDKYNEAVKGARQDVLDQQVKDGRLTTDQAKQMKESWNQAPSGAPGFGMVSRGSGMRSGVPGAGSVFRGSGPAGDCSCT